MGIQTSITCDQCKKDLQRKAMKKDVRSKGTRNDYEVVERFVELLHEGFDGGRDEEEEIEFEAIRKELGYTAYAARELYHLRNRVEKLDSKEMLCFWDAGLQRFYLRGEYDQFIVDRLVKHCREKLDEERCAKAKLGLYNHPTDRGLAGCALVFSFVALVFSYLAFAF